MDSIHQARLAQSVKHQTLNRRVVGSSPTVDKKFFILYFVTSDAFLAGRLAPCKWNQAWRPSELYMCIEREEVDYKNREVNCLKECALALSLVNIDMWCLKKPHQNTGWSQKMWYKNLQNYNFYWYNTYRNFHALQNATNQPKLFTSTIRKQAFWHIAKAIQIPTGPNKFSGDMILQKQMKGTQKWNCICIMLIN